MCLQVNTRRNGRAQKKKIGKANTCSAFFRTLLFVTPESRRQRANLPKASCSGCQSILSRLEGMRQMKVESASGAKAPPRVWKRDPFVSPDQQSVHRISQITQGSLEMRVQGSKVTQETVNQVGLEKERSAGDIKVTEGCGQKKRSA